MVLSRNIASPILVGFAVLGVALLWASRGFQFEKVKTQLSGFKTPLILSGLLVSFMAASLLWSPIPFRGADAWIAALLNGAALVASLFVVARFRPNSQTVHLGLAVSLMLTAVLILIEIRYQSPVRTFLGGTAEMFRMNRASVAISLFLPLLFFVTPRKPVPLVALAAITIICIYAIFSSISESAKLAVLVAPIAAAGAYVLGRAAIPFFAAGVLISLWGAPFVAPYINDLIPQAVHQAVGYGTLGVRADIWSAYGSLLSLKPIIGQGLEASYVAADMHGHLVPDETMLGKAHPHNFAVQVWYELGLAGVVLISALLMVFFSSLRHLPKPMIPAVLASTAAVWTISLVSHGAWQSWWWSLVGIVALIWVVIYLTKQQADAPT